MKQRSLLYILLLLIPLTSRAQYDMYLEKWPDKVIEKANTGEAADYLTEDERRVILFTNLARADGPRFAETFLDPYLGSSGTEKNSYVRSLYKDLKDTKSLQMLKPEKDLYEVARGHATKSGQKNRVGHQEFNKRFKPLMGKYNAVAENCDYGHSGPLDIVMSLLIDNGIESLGHRKNMLDPIYNSIGVSIQPHEGYNYNCVMDFGRKSY